MNGVVRYLVIALLSHPILAPAQVKETFSNWTLVYAHDSLGHVSSGSKETLLQAVRQGARVRIGYQIPFRDSVVEHIFSADQITIFKNEVYAQCESMTSQRWDHPELVIWFGEKPFTFYTLCSTSGQCDEMAVEWPSGKKLMHRPTRRNLQWFVDK